VLIAYLENEADRAAIRRLGNSPSLMLASTPPDFADRVLDPRVLAAVWDVTGSIHDGDAATLRSLLRRDIPLWLRFGANPSEIKELAAWLSVSQRWGLLCRQTVPPSDFALGLRERAQLSAYSSRHLSAASPHSLLPGCDTYCTSTLASEWSRRIGGESRTLPITALVLAERQTSPKRVSAALDVSGARLARMWSELSPRGGTFRVWLTSLRLLHTLWVLERATPCMETTSRLVGYSERKSLDRAVRRMSGVSVSLLRSQLTFEQMKRRVEYQIGL